ncbi:MAG: STM4013/SEN3800 family hydrolase [Deltaproteobacteria bacterium]|nr:STM4013/SEN3800 family hydrolase [Deltaproteobacteria bacterium]
MLNVRSMCGTHDVFLMVIDTLRYDVAVRELTLGRTPNLRTLLGEAGWEKRHSPASFTYPAHHAFFAGFLPTPTTPGPHPRLIALEFPGSESVGEATLVLDAPNIVEGFAAKGYRTICVGGVGFFSKQNPLSRVLPGYFQESHFSRETSVIEKYSTRNQVALLVSRLSELPPERRHFTFLNVSALHQPNYFYLDGATEDSIESHAAALRYVDSELPPLIDALRRRGPVLAIVCSDHGTAYGEDGHVGHRVAHPVVWEVPYSECVLAREGA